MAPPLPATGVAHLLDWGVIRASGADAATFLHGQLTHDVAGLAVGQARLAGYCSAKGRLQATLVVSRTEPEQFLLAGTAQLVPALAKRLSMFVLRAKCTVSDASAEVSVWGALGPWAGALPLPPGLVDGMHVDRGLMLRPAGELADGPRIDPELWRWVEVHAAVARIVPATVDRFVPQMVNLELVDGVSFRKGCYPGQEVVARSQFRGTLKRRGIVVHADVPLAPGDEIFHSDDAEQPAGLVALSASWGGRHAAFVEVKLSALSGGTLHAGRSDGPLLHPVPMPYELPSDAAAEAVAAR
jgi:folate-binding protein YgfZ